MKPSTVLIAAAPLALAVAACDNTAEPDERVVDDTNYDTPADIELPEVPVETPTVANEGTPATDGTPETAPEPMMEPVPEQ